MYGGSSAVYSREQRLENSIDNAIDEVFHAEQGDSPVRLGKFNLVKQFDGTVQIDTDGVKQLITVATKAEARKYLREQLDVV